MADSETQPSPESPAGEPPQFTSQHTANFPGILKQLGISLAITTYQAGKLILVRADGDQLNTHFRAFHSPMGLAYEPDTQRLAIGTRYEVWEFHNQPRVAPKLEPLNRCDAAFLPRSCHFSGDIRIHEIAWIQGRIWAVNTRFSCLSTFDPIHSFVPEWRPPFVSALSPEDRCHLNGLCVRDGRIRWLTCLGATDSADGWRATKANGGCLLDYPSGEIAIQGLSMPHSPRHHMEHHWILESGVGSLSLMDPTAGTTQIVAKLPGFTRGLDFAGPIAFVGLSQVRESAIFSGIPLVDEMPERSCGVWAVDLRSGQTLAFLKFDGIVQEIFAVQVLPTTFPDLINEPGEVLDSSFVLPDKALRDVPSPLQS
ncbi:MAG: TIGR03032 family protein [Terrimicrobiaceae bacterium]